MEMVVLGDAVDLFYPADSGEEGGGGRADAVSDVGGSCSESGCDVAGNDPSDAQDDGV